MSHEEKFLNMVQEADRLVNADAHEVRELMRNKAFHAVLNELLVISDSMGAAMLGADLTTDKGVKETIGYQAKAQAYSEVVEHCASIYQEIQSKQEEKENAN